MTGSEITFIDLFAGIGGFRLALEQVGFHCVFSAEIDPHACAMYEANFCENPYCDITLLDPARLPVFDVLCAGFPCQAFSISGKQKGFYDAARGTLFFDICRILEHKRPSVFILENVQNLEKHDRGKTLMTMLSSLATLGYSVNYKVLNAKEFGVPQNRERIILVGTLNKKSFNFEKIIQTPIASMASFLETDGSFDYLEPESYTLLQETEVKRQPKSGLIFVGYRNKNQRSVGVREGTEHLSRVHKQPNRIYSSLGTHPTIASQEQSGRYWIYHNKRVRKLTLSECYSFFGFPSSFKKVGTTSKLYERIGNSVCVPMIQQVAQQVREQFFSKEPSVMPNAASSCPSVFLETVYQAAFQKKTIEQLQTSDELREALKVIAQFESTQKGVFTVLVTSLTYKALHPIQDVRYHQANLLGGYSGRSFDTKYVTPFLKQKGFLGAMKESGWLTRSLEQNSPYLLDYRGKITNKAVKHAFLSILHAVEETELEATLFATQLLTLLFFESIQLKAQQAITLISPIERENVFTISCVLKLLEAHFYYPYKVRGASILPVLAFHSIYTCLMKEVARFKNASLQPLASHTSSDRSSQLTGDIIVLNAQGELYEVVEIKFDIAPTSILIEDIYKKIAAAGIQRYYVLSTKLPSKEEADKISIRIEEIRAEQGCQIIVNGLLDTLKYYLRLLENPDSFLEEYRKALEVHPEIQFEQKLAWNKLLDTTLNSP